MLPHEGGSCQLKVKLTSISLVANMLSSVATADACLAKKHDVLRDFLLQTNNLHDKAYFK